MPLDGMIGVVTIVVHNIGGDNFIIFYTYKLGTAVNSVPYHVL